MSRSRTAILLPGIVLFTIVETAGLGAWLALVRGEATVSTAAALGVGILFVALVVEAIINTVAVNGFGAIRIGAIFTFSLTETLVWVVWFGLADRLGGLDGVAIAGVVLFVLMLPQHSIEDNVLRGRSLFGNVLELGTSAFTFVEAAGATVWLAFVLRGESFLASAGIDTIPVLSSLDFELGALVGLLLLGVALLIEHLMGVQFAMRMGEPGEGV